MRHEWWPNWSELAVVELGERAAGCWLAVHRYELGDVSHIGDHYVDNK